MIADSWDECGPKAHWRSRKPGQPFFAVFNLMETHQGEMFKETPLDRTFRHDPEKAPVPPYLPDTQEARRTMARIHDCMTEMDEHLGKILDELKEEGLERETIVFFWSDHGQGIPRGKRTLWDTGLKVPMIVRFPSKFQSLAPEKSGATSDRLIMLMDLGPTLLSLAGLSVPSGLHGQAFLGKEAGEPRKYVYGARDRVDEVLELSRSVRDENYLYIKNYMPHLSWMQPEGYSDQLPLRREIATLAVEGKLNVNQLTFAGPRKPLEELYDTKNDPWQLNNLATIPAMQPILEKMRQELRRWQLDTRDSGFLHEWQAAKLCENGKSLHEIIASDKHYPLERLCNIADNVGRLGQAAYFAKLLDDSDHTVRYWAMVGLKASGQDAAEFKEQIIHAMNDESMPIQIEAAGIMVDLFGDSRAYELLGRTLEGTEIHAVVHASRTIELLGEKARPLIPVIHRVLAKKPSMPVVFSLKETLRFFK